MVVDPDGIEIICMVGSGSLMFGSGCKSSFVSQRNSRKQGIVAHFLDTPRGAQTLFFPSRCAWRKHYLKVGIIVFRMLARLLTGREWDMSAHSSSTVAMELNKLFYIICNSFNRFI